jgi:hypothetical protein
MVPRDAAQARSRSFRTLVIELLQFGIHRVVALE